MDAMEIESATQSINKDVQTPQNDGLFAEDDQSGSVAPGKEQTNSEIIQEDTAEGDQAGETNAAAEKLENQRRKRGRPRKNKTDAQNTNNRHPTKNTKSTEIPLEEENTIATNQEDQYEEGIKKSTRTRKKTTAMKTKEKQSPEEPTKEVNIIKELGKANTKHQEQLNTLQTLPALTAEQYTRLLAILSPQNKDTEKKPPSRKPVKKPAPEKSATKQVRKPNEKIPIRTTAEKTPQRQRKEVVHLQSPTATKTARKMVIKKATPVVYTPISQLRENQTAGKVVKVLVIKAWVSESKKAGEAFSFDMHLMDEEGTQIQAKTYKDDIDAFVGKVSDGRVYSINTFTVKPQTGNYRIVSYKYVIHLSRFSEITELDQDPSTFPNQKFRFFSLERISERSQNAMYYTDVIGKIQSLSNVVKRTSPHDGRQSTIREMVIENERGTSVKITLWGELGSKIKDTVLRNSSNQAAIAIVTGTYVKVHRDQYSLSTSNASRILINMNIPQINVFRRLIDAEDANIDTTHIDGDEELYKNAKTLKEINKMLLDPAKKNTSWNCEAKIVGMVKDKDWHYEACTRCHKKVINRGGNYSCPSCTSAVYEGHEPWYTLNMRVKDKTDRAVFTIIGYNAERILNYTAREHIDFLNRCEKLNEADRALKHFDALIGETYIFKILIEEKNIDKLSDNYKVLKVSKVSPAMKAMSACTLKEKEPTPKKKIQPKAPSNTLKTTTAPRKRKLRKIVVTDDEDDTDKKEDLNDLYYNGLESEEEEQLKKGVKTKSVTNEEEDYEDTEPEYKYEAEETDEDENGQYDAGDYDNDGTEQYEDVEDEEENSENEEEEEEEEDEYEEYNLMDNEAEEESYNDEEEDDNEEGDTDEDD